MCGDPSGVTVAPRARVRTVSRALQYLAWAWGLPATARVACLRSVADAVVGHCFWQIRACRLIAWQLGLSVLLLAHASP